MIMACPNCYYFLKGRLDAEIISVYEKMAELKIGNIYQKERIPMYYPCPDRKDRKFEYDMKPFLIGKMYSVAGLVDAQLEKKRMWHRH